MAISLTIRWAGGGKEDVPVAHQHTAEVVWLNAAKQLGLRQYDGVFPMYFDESNIADVIADFEKLRDFQKDTDDFSYERLTRLVSYLKKLQESSDWSAYIG